MAQHKTTKYHQDYIESSVQRIYDKSAPMLLCESILFACIGGAMLANPMGILTIITFILGGALLVLGVYRTIAGFIASNDYGGGWLDVTFGFVGLLYIFIILFMVKAISALIFAINMVRVRFGHYVFNLIMAIILVGIATILLFNPLAGALAVVMVVACMLLIYALTDLYMFIQVKRFKHHVIG